MNTLKAIENELAKDLPIIIPVVELAATEIFAEIQRHTDAHPGGTHTMAADVLHRSLDLVLELLSRSAPKRSAEPEEPFTS